MLIKIQSDNPNLLSLLNKNPESDNGVYLSSYKEGVAVGVCISANEYHMFFHDDGSDTFGTGEVMDYLWGVTPNSFVIVLNQLLDDLFKNPDKVNERKISWLDNKTFGELDTYETKIEIDNFLIDSSWYRDGEFLLSKYVDGVEIIGGGEKLHKLVVTKRNLHQAINTVVMVALMCEVSNKDSDLYIEEGFARKYIKILGNIENVPYFVFYLYAKRILSRFIDKSGITLVKELSEVATKTIGLECEMTQFGTHFDRLRFIRNLIDRDVAVLNYGCEGFFYEKKIKNMTAPWVSYDIVDMTENFNKIVESGYRNIVQDWTFSNDLDEINKNQVYQVIMSEVLEHNRPEDFEKELTDLVNKFKVSRLIITTPNKGFNKHYFLNDDEGTSIRREDHIHEMGGAEFKEYITKWVSTLSLETTVEFSSIGDVVDGEAVTSGVVIDFIKYNTNETE